MQLLRLGELRMRRNSGGVAGGMRGFTSSPPTASSDQQKKLGAVDGVNFAKNSAPTFSSLSHSTNKLFIYVVALVVIISAFSSYADMYGVSASPRCAPCPGIINPRPLNDEDFDFIDEIGGECPEPPEGTCLYGVVTNFCGRRVCAKGPGQVCGTGMFKMLGSCGDGMYCNCGRCIGCSVFTLECFDKTCTK